VLARSLAAVWQAPLERAAPRRRAGSRGRGRPTVRRVFALLIEVAARQAPGPPTPSRTRAVGQPVLRGLDADVLEVVLRRARCTRIKSWLSATCSAGDCVSVLVDHPDIDVMSKPMLGVATTLSTGAGVGTDQSSGRAAKSRLVFRYHPIPDKGFFHLPCISVKAPLCVSSPLTTISFRWLSCAFMTSLAVLPWSVKSHGPPNCLHVMVFIGLASFRSMRPSTMTSRNG
jgi:hypothetical protein